MTEIIKKIFMSKNTTGKYVSGELGANAYQNSDLTESFAKQNMSKDENKLLPHSVS